MPYSQLRDAKTLGEGNSRIGLAMNVMKVGAQAEATVKDGAGNEETGSTDDLDDIPGVPWFMLDFGYGINDHMDIGARVSTAGGLLDLKLGLIQGDFFNLAVDPAIGYSFFLISSGPRVDLPIIVSIGGDDVFAYGGAAYSRHWLAGELFEQDELVADVLTGFGGVGFEFKSVYLKAELAYSEVQMDADDFSTSFSLIQPTFLIGVKWGEQINELEKRIDRLERRQAPQGAPAPGNGGSSGWGGDES